MIQLHMYLNEITNFLRTLTIKDTLIADQMLNIWVNDEYKGIVEQSLNAHPYYRQMLGEYIVFDHEEIYPVIEKLYDDRYLFLNEDDERYRSFDSKEEKYNYIKEEVLDKLFPLETTVKWRSPYTSDVISRTIPNKQLYRYCNKIPVIYSYDTQTQIPYTREFLHKQDDKELTDWERNVGFINTRNLGIRSHANTAAVYKIPQQRYIKLLSRYPSETEIIKSVTYPIKAKNLLDAENFSILSYDESLLEVSEYQSIINCVSDTLTMIRRRYAVEGFVYENLYASAHYYLIWQILYLAIFVQRIQNIKSGSAHTYHIWKYLKSHGFEDYRDILSVLQQKFLYKNLPYINKHKGTQHALELLTYVFLTTKNMSLHAKNLMQSVNDPELTTDTAKKYPIVNSIKVAEPSIRDISAMKRKSRTRFEKILYYLGENAGLAKLTDEQEYNSGELEDINELYQRERAAKLEYQDDYLFEQSTARHTHLMTYSPTSHLNTKLLEIKSDRTINDYAMIYTKFIAESLLYLASKDQLNMDVEVQLANSARPITLKAKEWIGMIFYALTKINNTEDKKLPSEYEHEECFKHPPTFAEIEWPFRLPEKVNGKLVAPEIPENFYWKWHAYKSKMYLNYVVRNYHITTGNREYNFALYLYKDNNGNYNVDDLTSCVWIAEDNSQLCYNPWYCWWNILDGDQNIVYHTAKLDSFNSYLNLLPWYDHNGNKVNDFTFSLISGKEKLYLADVKLNPYRDAEDINIFTSLEKLSTDLHQQGINFLETYISANGDESAIIRALYDTLMYTFCVVDEVTEEDNVSFKLKKYVVDLRGKLLTDISGNDLSYEDYLKQDYNNDIVVLKGVLELYDTSSDFNSLYCRMIDKIMDTLLPNSSEFLTYGVLTVYNRYKRVIDLFKSMTAYNLAYLDPKFENYTDTKLSVHVSDFTRFSIFRTITDFSMLPSTIDQSVYGKWKLKYVDQEEVLQYTFDLSDDPDTDNQYKQILLDYIDQITTILTTKKLSKAKKKKKLKNILELYRPGEDFDGFIESIIDLPHDKLFALRSTKHRIHRHNVDVKIIVTDHVSFENYDNDDYNYKHESVKIIGTKATQCFRCERPILENTTTNDEED